PPPMAASPPPRRSATANIRSPSSIAAPEALAASGGVARMADASVTAAPGWAAAVRRIAAGFLFSALVAAIAVIGAPWVARAVTIPAMVLALLIGIALNPLAARPVFQPGLAFCVKVLLRWAVAL